MCSFDFLASVDAPKYDSLRLRSLGLSVCIGGRAFTSADRGDHGERFFTFASAPLSNVFLLFLSIRCIRVDRLKMRPVQARLASTPE